MENYYEDFFSRSLYWALINSLTLYKMLFLFKIEKNKCIKQIW